MAKKSAKKTGAAAPGVERMILDPDFDFEQKKFILHNLVLDGSEEADSVVGRILAAAAEARR